MKLILMEGQKVKEWERESKCEKKYSCKEGKGERNYCRWMDRWM